MKKKRTIRADQKVSSHGKRGKAFTLVEIMAAVAVLAILGALIAQITAATTRTTRVSNRAVDAASQARLALDRIGLDLAALVKRQDVDFFAQDPTDLANSGYNADNLLLFLSEVYTSGADRKLSLVAYQIGSHDDNDGKTCLLRAGVPIPWDRPVGWGSAAYMGYKSNGLPVSFRTTDLGFVQDLQPGASDFDVLAPGVLQMVVGFQLYPDNQSVRFKDGSSPAPNNAQGQIVYSPPVRGLTTQASDDFIDLERISGLVVGVVAVDAENLKLLSASDTRSLSGKFSVPNDGELPVQAWGSIAADVDGLGSGIPLPARQALRVYQRFYPITPYGSKGL